MTLGSPTRAAAHGQHLLLAAGQGAGGLRQALTQRREADADLLQPRPPGPGLLGGRAAMGDAQVVLHGERREDAPALGDEHEAARGDRVGTATVDAATGQPDRPTGDVDGAGDGPQGRRLAHAVGSEQGDDGPLGHLEVHAVQHLDASVPGAHTGQLQRQRHAVSSAGTPRYASRTTRVGGDLLRRSGRDHHAEVEDVDPLGEGHDEVHVVLDEEHPHAPGCHLTEDLLEGHRLGTVEAAARLVEEQHLRPHAQGPPELDEAQRARAERPRRRGGVAHPGPRGRARPRPWRRSLARLGGGGARAR